MTSQIIDSSKMQKETSYSPVPASAAQDKDEDLEVRIVKPVDGRRASEPR